MKLAYTTVSVEDQVERMDGTKGGFINLPQSMSPSLRLKEPNRITASRDPEKKYSRRRTQGSAVKASHLGIQGRRGETIRLSQLPLDDNFRLPAENRQRDSGDLFSWGDKKD